MLNRCTTTFITSALALTFMLSGCSTRQRQIEIQKPQPSTTPPPNDEPEWRPSEETTASVVTEIPEDELVKYMDANAKLEFKFTYVGTEKTGPITFADGKARMEIRDLPINQNGTMVMQLFENAVLKLEGTKDNVTLRAGVNSESLSLKVVPATKPDKPDVKPDTPDVKPDKPDVKPDTPVTPVTPVTPTTPETAELVLTLEIQ
jgi:hypothetical protein